jgi:hypothetical protein
MKIPKKRLHAGIARFRQQFGDQPARAMGAVLEAQVIAEALEKELGPVRERVYPPLTTLGLFIGQALSADGACQDAVARQLSARCARGQGPCSLSTGPYCKARQRLPLGLIHRLGVAVGETLERQSPSQWKWRGRSVKLVDGTTVSMPDTAANQARYPQSGEALPGLGFPLAMLLGLISLSTGAVLGWALGPCRGKRTGELAMFRALMSSLDPGDVVVADRLHCTYFTVAMLRERGVDLVTRQHSHRRTDRRCGKRLGRHDRLVQWHRPRRPEWMDAETYARMPETLMVRHTEVAGRLLVSTLTEARSVEAAEIQWLYKQRWQVELDLRSIKVEMGMDIVRAKSPEMVDKVIGVHLLAYNLVCALRARAGAQARIPARALSFKASMQLFNAFEQSLRYGSYRHAKAQTASMLEAIATRKLPVRPDRVEPQAVKRRPKRHPLLQVPRHIARAQILRNRAAEA